MQWLKVLTSHFAPAFIVISPVLSYSDQAYSMWKNKSSAGFSLDIPLIMLVASICRIFYYPGARFDTALLVQSFIMVAIQSMLLKIALDYRPAPSHRGGNPAVPFANVGHAPGIFERKRPYNFWQWRSPMPYWQFLFLLLLTLAACEITFGTLRGSIYPAYSSVVGYTGLLIEAFLPVPQIAKNAQSRSCKGFRLSVLGFWLFGDAMKMLWFFTATTEIPWAFKLCGIFQAGCDAFLGLQYCVYGKGGLELGKGNSEALWKKSLGNGVGSGRGTPISSRRTSIYLNAKAP